MSLFRVKSLITNPNTFYIVDHTGMYRIDDEYRKTGIDEGWLVLDGYYRINQEFAFYYRLV